MDLRHRAEHVPERADARQVESVLPRRSLRQYAEQLDEEIEVLMRQPFIKRRAVVARSADEEVHQAQSGALRSDEAETIAPFVEGRNHGSSEVI